MDYEKKYKEALERARKLYNDAKANEYKSDMEDYEFIFPGLAESEDERIRKTLVEYFGPQAQLDFVRGVPIQKIRVWLEKQKEPENTSASTMAPSCWEVEQKEQKPAEYLDKDKIYAIMKKLHDLSFSKDILINSKEYKQIDEITHDVRSLLDYPINQQSTEWSEEDKRKLNRIYSIIGWAMDEHAFSSCKKLLGDKEGVELQDFLRSIAKPKQSWSEEDEKKIIFLERLIEHNVPDGQYGWVDGMKGGFVTKSEAISMLKSLRPQYHGDVTMTEAYKMGLEAGKASSWKPSEEDLMMLEHIIGQYEIGNKNSKVMGYLPRIEELDFLKKVLAKWKN